MCAGFRVHFLFPPAIREDCSANLQMVERLTSQFAPVDFCLLEAGGDNLSANFSRELADYIIYVIDVAGGDKIPRKGGPGITQADLLVVNKTDLAEAVGADLELMRVQGENMRGGGPIEFAQVKHMKGVEEIAEHFLDVWRNTPAGKAYKQRKEQQQPGGSAAAAAGGADDQPPPLEPRT
jgi:urease accessory protein